MKKIMIAMVLVTMASLGFAAYTLNEKGQSVTEESAATAEDAKVISHCKSVADYAKGIRSQLTRYHPNAYPDSGILRGIYDATDNDMFNHRITYSRYRQLTIILVTLQGNKAYRVSPVDVYDLAYSDCMADKQIGYKFDNTGKKFNAHGVHIDKNGKPL